MAVVFEVPDRYHITDVATGLFYLEFDSIGYGELSESVFPPGEMDGEDRVFRGKIIVTTDLTGLEDTSTTSDLSITGCDAGFECSSTSPGYYVATASDSVTIVKDCDP